jgi:cobyrinic acid a,c-diamide synthase
MVKGHGLDGSGDGIVYKNVLASYTHLHALGCPEWARAMRDQAERYRGFPAGGLRQQPT